MRPQAVGLKVGSAPGGLILVSTAGLIAILSGCHAKEVTQQFTVGFDQAISRLYESHVLNNLARCDNDEFFVQMAFDNFGSDITRTGTLTAQVTLFSTQDAETGTQNVIVNLFDQSYSPTLSHSQSSRLGFTASPAEHQAEILALYRAEVDKPPEERFFFVTDKFSECLGTYCFVRRKWNSWYAVPHQRKREFCEFVQRVCFYQPPAVQTASAATPGPSGAVTSLVSPPPARSAGPLPETGAR